MPTAPTLVHAGKATPGGSPRTLSFGFTATAGNLLRIYVTSTTDTGSPPTISGFTQANDGVNDGTVLAGSTRRVTGFWKIAAGGETSVSIVQASVGSLAADIEEWSHPSGWPANPVHQIAEVTNGASSVASLPSMSVTTTLAECVVTAAAGLASFTNPLASNSFTVDQSDATNQFTAYQTETAAGTYSTVLSWTTARVSCGVMVAYAPNVPATKALPAPPPRARRALYRK